MEQKIVFSSQIKVGMFSKIVVIIIYPSAKPEAFIYQVPYFPAYPPPNYVHNLVKCSSFLINRVYQ